jgi:hypothetical protein
MEKIYDKLREWNEETRLELWKQWLWSCDGNAPPLERCCDMNEMQIYGILACLGEHAQPPPSYDEQICAESVGGPAIIHLHPDTPVNLFSLRELLDQLECFQLNWGPILAECGYDVAFSMLRALMARLGEIAHNAYPLEVIHPFLP